MKTKEEILETKNWNSEYPNYMAESEILDAMDEYAKQEVVNYDKWRHKQKYVQYLGFDTPTYNKEKPIAGKEVYFSTEQLYELYLQSKQETK